jgi:glycosyltransferase involved in cell wall biosynthesis
MFEDYHVNIKNLQLNNLPIGVSGYLRVYNEAETLALCIKSVVNALDELIIVVQESSDNSLQIAEALEQEYPNKIRVFAYPFINFTEDINNIHSFVNYSNFVLSKCRYSYGVKIDADQIYISAKLQMICDIYRGCKVKFTALDFLKSLLPYCDNAIKIKKYYRAVQKKFNKYKRQNVLFFTSLAGINLIYKNGEYHVPLEYPCNGVQDHLIHKNDNNFYFINRVDRIGYERYGDCGVPLSKYKVIYTGLFWLHTAFMKPNRIGSFNKDNTMQLSTFLIRKIPKNTDYLKRFNYFHIDSKLLQKINLPKQGFYL